MKKTINHFGENCVNPAFILRKTTLDLTLICLYHQQTSFMFWFFLYLFSDIFELFSIFCLWTNCWLVINLTRNPLPKITVPIRLGMDDWSFIATIFPIELYEKFKFYSSLLSVCPYFLAFFINFVWILSLSIFL